VGIGQSSPSYKLEVNGTCYVSSTLTTNGLDNRGFDLVLGNGDQVSRGNSNNSRALVKNTGNVLAINFAGDFTGGTEFQSSLSVSGNLSVTNSTSIIQLNSTETYAMMAIGLSSGKSAFLTFRNGSDEIGSIYRNRFNGTTYGATSDHRIKSNISKLTGSLEKILSVNPVIYNVKDVKERTQGFVAHEIQTVCPEAVKGYKDEVDTKGKPILQSVDYGKLTTLLWGAIHELSSEIEMLKKSYLC
jgi:hypothetical protein